MAEEADEQMNQSMRIMAKLIDDALEDRRRTAQEQSASCLRCLDTGLDCGRFCACDSGARLNYGHG